MTSIEQAREAVAAELEARGFSNREFIAEVRDGRRDDGPYMIGALALARCVPIEGSLES